MELNSSIQEGQLNILAFPCGQFGQEFETAVAIRKAVESKGVPVNNSDAGFLLMEKVNVNGSDAHPVFKFLKSATDDSSDVKWNFGSYWLVGKDGSVQRLAGGRNTPSKFAPDIAKVLD
mmetsp:Transcript_104284/g.162537  ORF Transcript_104284/g.162537 Transcript_104284/m.162537 type:complete len:119 (+) Transcript_104284:272-628(+)